MLLLLAVLLAGPALMRAQGAGRLAGAGRRAVHAARGGSVTLRCDVMDALDSQVSWVRSRDLQILAHGGAVFTADARVSAGAGAVAGAAEGAAPAGRRHWLRVAALRDADAGRYECQLNTEPKQSLFIDLVVLDPSVTVVTETALTTALPTETEDKNGAGGAARQTEAMQRDQAWSGAGRSTGGTVRQVMLLLVLYAATAG